MLTFRKMVGRDFGGSFDLKTASNGVFADVGAFNRKDHLLFAGIRTAELANIHAGVVSYREALDKGGIRAVFYQSPGTAQEWLTRRCDSK